MKTSQEPQRRTGGLLGITTMMMACCMAIVFLFLMIPALGWPLGLAVGLTGGAALLFAHQKLMGHHGH